MGDRLNLVARNQSSPRSYPTTEPLIGGPMTTTPIVPAALALVMAAAGFRAV